MPFADDRLAQTEHALSVAIGWAAGFARSLAAQSPQARSRIETALLDAIDDLGADPVAVSVLQQILRRLDSN